MKILNWLLRGENRPRKSRTFGLEAMEQRVLLSAAPIISEVHPGGSGNGSYAADWFEVTNVDTAPLDITGWKMDDNSNAFASAVSLRGVTNIPAGKSAVFFEGAATDTNDATIIAAFSNAWFGNTTPPAGFLIGAYGGTGVGLSTTADAVNLLDAAGNRVTGVSFGAATANTTFDNVAGLGSTTLPLPTVSTVSVAGVNGGFVSANGQETGSPGTMGVSTVDLSLYVRVGRFDLPEPTRTVAPPNSLLAQEASAVTYNWNTNTLFVVGDGGTSIVQVSKTGQLIDSMTLAPGSSPQGTDFYDPEGLTYVGNGKFVMSEERDRQAVLFTYAPGTTLTRSLTQTVKLGTFVDNIGIEGISYDPQTGGFIAVKETQPEGIFQTLIDFNAGTASNGSPTTENSANLFDPALANLLDFADVFALSNLPSLRGAESTHILILSQESGKIVEVDRSGTIFSSLTIVSDPGNPLSVANQQHEGMTMDGNGFLYVASENGGGDINHPQLWVYAPSTTPNKAPTAIALTNQVNSIVENTSSAAPLKVADIAITDDGLGANNLSLSGADAAFFEITGNALYIKAGTTLDFETKTSYSVNVSVDDTTLGNTPDATSSFALSIIDVVNEIPALASLIISEVSPWSSGNTPYAADWFEVTNTGTSDVDITGWKMDDNSNLFANAVALRGVTLIPAGKSAVFFEGDPSGVTDAAIIAAFSNAWFGTSTPPAGFLIGAYGGSGVGLSTSGDAVNLFDATGNHITGVTFGASTNGTTFDNTGGLAAVTTLSVDGVHGAFIAADNTETGSPGTIASKVIISEVAPWASGNSGYAADWFEVTNTGVTSVDLAGWKMDDNSNLFGSSVALRGVTRIAAGKSAVFLEGAADGSTDATILAAFSTAWFGSATLPAGLLVGTYGGGGVGLSTSGDAVNLFDSAGNAVTGVRFASSTTGLSFDNTAGLAAVSTLSAAGVHGAFLASDGIETGSPGTITASLIISEVAPWASGNSPYTADWLEITNNGTLPVDLAGMAVDDNSNLFANAVALRGVSRIDPGKSAVFIEGLTDGSTDATIKAAFLNAWFGSVPPPADLQVGGYGGGGIGLSTGGDAVNLFDAVGNRITGVSFGASTTGISFDNAAGLGSTTLPLPTISNLTVAGTHGAFLAADGVETGSPGTIIPNVAPVASADAVTTAEDTAVTFNVLGNDTDADGDSVKILGFTQSSHGTLTDEGHGNFSYTPATNFNGSDSFTYIISDGKGGGTATGAVSITVSAVNDAPVAGNESFITNEDVPLTIVGMGVLTNDTDVENNPLTAVLVSGVSHGTLTLNASGSFTYTPAANFNGTDSFTYRANDGTTDSNVATVTIAVKAVNDAPVAKSDRYSTDKHTTLTVAGKGVLTNDSDVDSTTLTALLVSGVSHGKLKLKADGSFTYTSDANFKGTDTFTYRVSDGTLTSNLATVTITVGEEHHCHAHCECGRHRHHDKHEDHEKHDR